MAMPREQDPDLFGFGDDPGRGRWGRFWTRVLENPDNPLGWSVRVFTAFGIAVRVHLFTVLFVGIVLAWSIPASNLGTGYTAIALACLIGLVLLHEFGHCFACRWVGGEADRIVLLPFGGLALTRPPFDWRSNLITTLGGPAVHIALLPVTIGLLLAMGLGAHILFPPFAPGQVLTSQEFVASSTAMHYLKAGAWWLYYVNLVLLALNLLVPAYPLDGGRVLQALLWRRTGPTRALEITAVVGFIAGGALGVVGLTLNQSALVLIAALVFWACWSERQRARSDVDLAADHFGVGAALQPNPEDDRAAERRAERERRAQEEVDAVLAKIARSGMDSLTARERRLLKSETRKRRGR